MDKRYQVFVSSTYADLQDERQEVMQALLELNCIPAGMELFPAADDDQWTLIKRVIDDSDYYLVIIAGRYGSTGPEGVSYTEMEYRYALKKGIPIIGFIHGDPGSLPAGRCESTEAGKEKLDSFREFVKNKVCRSWDSPADLGSKVSRSLVQLIKTNPAIGWVRGNLVPDATAAEEILRLRARIEELEKGLNMARTEAPKGTESLAQGEDNFRLTLFFDIKTSPYESKMDSIKVEVKWNELFEEVSPLMIDELNEREFAETLSLCAAAAACERHDLLNQYKNQELKKFRVFQDDFQTIKVQFRALGLITQSSKARSVKDRGTYWTLTPYGDTIMTRLKAISREKKEPGA